MQRRTLQPRILNKGKLLFLLKYCALSFLHFLIFLLYMQKASKELMLKRNTEAAEFLRRRKQMLTVTNKIKLPPKVRRKLTLVEATPTSNATRLRLNSADKSSISSEQVSRVSTTTSTGSSDLCRNLDTSSSSSSYSNLNINS